jgi:membrane fusion protein (multidrug efflux system)
MFKSFHSYIVIGVALMLSQLLMQCSSKSKDKEKSKGKESVLIPVSGVVVQHQLLNNQIDIMGTILANEKVDLHCEVGGRVIGIYFKEGSQVRKGERLIKIYDQDLQAQLRKVQLQQELAQKELDRKNTLLEIKGISLEELDIAINQVNTLKADAELIAAQLRKTEIIAPFNGIIGLR